MEASAAAQRLLGMDRSRQCCPKSAQKMSLVTISSIDQAASQPANENRQPESRALVPLSPAAARTSRRQAGRSTAEFTAQLIAAKDKAPQSRARRRADPTEALAAYQTASRLLNR
jgi:hypothetical protein